MPSVGLPLVLDLPLSPTPGQKRDALREALRAALIPEELAEDIASFLDIDETGQVYITDEGIGRLREILRGIAIPEEAEGSPLAVFQAVLGVRGNELTTLDRGATSIVFFEISDAFIGKRCDSLQVVKMFSSTEADVFPRVHSLDALLDGCSAVVEVEGDPGDETLVRVLDAGDAFTANCRLALAIRDGGRYDLDGEENGTVTDPAFMVEGEVSGAPDDPQRSGSGGCSAGGLLIPSAVLFLAPLALLAAGRKK